MRDNCPFSRFWLDSRRSEVKGERRFGRFRIGLERRALWIDDERAKIGARAFDVLVALFERRQKIVSKSELLDLVWPGLAVEESNLHVQMSTLRKILGPGIIATVPGRGYRFVAALEDHGGLPADTLPQPVAADALASRTNVPPRTEVLFGRDHDRETLRALLSRHRLVTIVGPGGIGKTQLALAIAHNLRDSARDGVWIVELSSVETAERVVSAVARLFGEAGGSAGALAALIEATRAQELLLVLDNCEHVIGAVAELSSALLAEAPGVKLIITSQVQMKTSGEQVYRLAPLDVPASPDAATAMQYSAIALFVARAQAADARFTLNADNVEAVVEICARLDAVPLAIELAAARVSLFGVQSIRRKLDERLHLFTGGPREALPRQRALAATMEWSYGLLSDDEKRVLDLLGIFVGGFSLTGAQELISDERVDPWAALDLLSTLIDKSLVVLDPGDPPRYRLLETTRAFALERLAATGALSSARRKHTLATIATLRALSPWDSPYIHAVSIAPDIANLRAAAAWTIGPEGDHALAIELAAQSVDLLQLMGDSNEGVVLFQTVEHWIDAATPEASVARLRLSRAKLYPSASRSAAGDGQIAAELFRRLGDRRYLFESLIHVVLQFDFVEDFASARRALSEARALLLPDWPTWMQLAYEYAVSCTDYWSGSFEAARRRLVQMLDAARAPGAETGQANLVEMLIVGCDVALRDAPEALRASESALRRANPPLRGFHRALMESFRCAALLQMNENDEAERSLRAALPQLKRALGSLHTTCCHLAFLAARRGRFADAARLVGAVEGLRPPGAMNIAPPNRASYQAATALATTALGSEKFENLRREGHLLSEDQAIAVAFDGDRTL
jgi:predicted ATPase/DNA-binding winged helix-turn-helix (wHTH) protein